MTNSQSQLEHTNSPAPRNKRIARRIAVILFALALVGLLAIRASNRHNFDVNTDMVWIEPGTFRTGGPDSGVPGPDGRVQIQVTISRGYYISKYEVTQQFYERLMGANPSYFSGLRALRHHPIATVLGKNLPVEQVSWHDAMEFCRRLTERERQAGRLPQGYVYSLPTEAQWELACRAGSDAVYCFGDSNTTLSRFAWYRENNNRRTQPVAEKQANALGLHDMHGNVWEWCRDWYATYPGGCVTDPTGPPMGASRVNRGGGWYGSAANCGCAYRNLDKPGYRKFGLGFRVACVPE